MIFFLTLWLIDYHLAKKQYLYGKQITVTMELGEADSVLWQMLPPEGRILEFLPTQIRQISLVHQQILGGAFQEVMGTVWQVEINLEDGNNLLIDQEKKAFIAVKKAKIIASYFNVPIIFISSEGKGKYAAEEIAFEAVAALPQTIKLQQKNGKFHIYSQWQLNNSWLLLKQIFQKSGFLLFLLVMNGFMLGFGALVNAIVLSNLGINVGVVYLPGIFHWFKPELGWTFWLTIAILVMIFKGANLSHAKHIYLDKEELKIYRDNQKIGQIKTKNIETTLLIKEPFSVILILGENQELIIQDLQQEAEFRAFILKLEEGLTVVNDQ
ncbi:MAG: hypothetical protein DSM107014_14110 [Gomphosphaeria aponina SAG 52.96 = DSM 107014]|uniref:Uncharacterized protein n=1 Tax=Gomphosphaeria aponina SAG 52.96 = DSM 107014 TaxID=1521640 RepID=A0A941GT51_9CHRO|nr:hypothetical protein [Gomphosphaeria aponina SAG 52.96 = DSM 107014]